MIDYTLILNYKYPGSEWIFNGDAYEGLDWLSDSPKPTKAALDKLWDETQKHYADKAAAKIEAREALLARLGITADDLALLLG